MILSTCNNLDEMFAIFEELQNSITKVLEYINIGEILMKKKEHQIKSLTESISKKVYNYNNLKVCMANVSSDLISELGNSLVENNHCDFAVLWRYDHTNELYYVSMRSKDVDVSEICKKFGGGGHQAAAACSLDKHPSIVFNN